MGSLFQSLNKAVAKRRAYARTVSELRAMSLDVALDLDIFREDAEKIATQAVYGR